MLTTQQLAQQVRLANLGNDLANRLYNLYAPVFAEFVGEQILMVNDKFFKRVEEQLPSLQSFGAVTGSVTSYFIERVRPAVNLEFAVRVAEPSTQGMLMYPVHVVLGRMKGRTLVAMCAAPELPTDLKVEPFVAASARASELQRELKQLQETLKRVGLDFGAVGLKL